MRRILFVALTLLVAASAFAQNSLPPGKWWRRPEIVQQLNLAEEQQNKLETIFRTASNDLIDLRGEVEKQNIALRGDLDQTQLDRVAIRRDAKLLSDARGRLFDRELQMLVDMRGVLNDAQWTRMRNQLGQMAAPRQQRMGNGNGRRNQ